MTNNATKTYRVGVIERAIAYYEVEAEDARAAAENWDEGEFRGLADGSAEHEETHNVREQQPDGTWRKVPKSEWDDAPPSQNVIAAAAHSDDHAIKVEFDALPWFEQASEQEIRDLAACGWGGDYPSDEIVFFLDETVPELSKLIAYLEIIAGDPAKKDCHGFECHVDEGRAPEWLRGHRKSLWAQLTGNKPYSVLLLYPDYANDSGTETYYAFVDASDPIAAIAVAQRQVVEANDCVGIDDPDDFAPLLVTAGHHYGEALSNK
jgi:hypothetical protein